MMHSYDIPGERASMKFISLMCMSAQRHGQAPRLCDADREKALRIHRPRLRWRQGHPPQPALCESFNLNPAWSWYMMSRRTQNGVSRSMCLKHSNLLQYSTSRMRSLLHWLRAWHHCCGVKIDLKIPICIIFRLWGSSLCACADLIDTYIIQFVLLTYFHYSLSVSKVLRSSGSERTRRD